MFLLALAIAPGLAICLYIFLRDQYNREPRKHLLVCFILGIGSALLAVAIESLLTGYFKIDTRESISSTILMAFVVVALTEEWSKYIMVRFYAFGKPEFDEPFDGIVYAVMVSMGFATVENIGYVMEYGYGTAFLRMFLSVPAHANFAIIMGYFMGKAKFAGTRRFLVLMTGLFWAVFFHGLYDLFLFLQENRMIGFYVSDSLLFAGAVGSFLLALHLSRVAIREHVALSERNHRNKLEEG